MLQTKKLNVLRMMWEKLHKSFVSLVLLIDHFTDPLAQPQPRQRAMTIRDRMAMKRSQFDTKFC